MSAASVDTTELVQKLASVENNKSIAAPAWKILQVCHPNITQHPVWVLQPGLSSVLQELLGKLASLTQARVCLHKLLSHL